MERQFGQRLAGYLVAGALLLGGAWALWLHGRSYAEMIAVTIVAGVIGARMVRRSPRAGVKAGSALSLLLVLLALRDGGPPSWHVLVAGYTTLLIAGYALWRMATGWRGGGTGGVE